MKYDFRYSHNASRRQCRAAWACIRKLQFNKKETCPKYGMSLYLNEYRIKLLSRGKPALNIAPVPEKHTGHYEDPNEVDEEWKQY